MHRNIFRLCLSGIRRRWVRRVRMDRNSAKSDDVSHFVQMGFLDSLRDSGTVRRVAASSNSIPHYFATFCNDAVLLLGC